MHLGGGVAVLLLATTECQGDPNLVGEGEEGAHDFSPTLFSSLNAAGCGLSRLLEASEPAELTEAPQVLAAETDRLRGGARPPAFPTLGELSLRVALTNNLVHGHIKSALRRVLPDPFAPTRELLDASVQFLQAEFPSEESTTALNHLMCLARKHDPSITAPGVDEFLRNLLPVIISDLWRVDLANATEGTVRDWADQETDRATDLLRSAIRDSDVLKPDGYAQKAWDQILTVRPFVTQGKNEVTVARSDLASLLGDMIRKHFHAILWLRTIAGCGVSRTGSFPPKARLPDRFSLDPERLIKDMRAKGGSVRLKRHPQNVRFFVNPDRENSAIGDWFIVPLLLKEDRLAGGSR